jgi:hypothetical protein
MSNALIIVHKLIRAELSATTAQLSCTDAEDARALLPALDALAELLHAHAAQEDATLAPLIEAADPPMAARMRADHVLLDDQYDQVRAIARQAASGDARASGPLMHQLRLGFHAFLAAYLLHLDDEERNMLPVLAQRVPPPGVIAKSAFARSAAEREAFLKKLFACITPSERRAIESALASEAA